MNDSIFFVVLFSAGAISNFINTMAGGGSMISLGTMMLLGVDPSVANGTNRIGVLVGAGSGAMAFKSEKLTNLRQSLYLGVCAIPGAIAGSLISVNLNDALFEKIIALIMILVLISLLIPQKRKQATTVNSPWIYPAMVLVGFYGGFIQIGVGFLLMASIKHFMAFDLIKTNMHKIFVVLIYSLPVLLVFGLSGNINWLYALILSAGSAMGSWISVKLAVKKGEKIVKTVLVIAIVLMAMKFLFGI